MPRGLGKTAKYVHRRIWNSLITSQALPGWQGNLENFRRSRFPTSRFLIYCPWLAWRAQGACGTRGFPLALRSPGRRSHMDPSNGLPGIIHDWSLPPRFTSEEFTVLVLAGIEGPDSPEGSGPIRDGVAVLSVISFAQFGSRDHCFRPSDWL